MLKRLPSLGRFLQARSGVAATEFAIMAPVLVILMLGVSEISGAIVASNRVNYLADALGEIMSRVRTTVTDAALKQYIVSAALSDSDIIDYAADNALPIESVYKATVTSVIFTLKVPSCTANCEYDANVVFSYSMNGEKRACGKLTASDSAQPTKLTLPRDVYGPGSLVVVDVQTKYKPLIKYKFDAELDFQRSVYFRPRYIKLVNSASNCPGYPT